MNTQMKMLSLAVGAGLILSGTVLAAKPEKKKAAAASAEDVFYVYTNRGSRLNHYVPSGWMGDYGDLKMNQGWTKEGGAADDTAIQIRYSAERKQGNGWSGIYWQHPANNWGDKRGGFDLSGYSKATFMARGDKGGEVIDKFFVGGITGQTEEGDSDEATVSPVTLTKDWKKYEIDFQGLDMSHIIGGFGFALNADANPDGATFFIDEVRMEK